MRTHRRAGLIPIALFVLALSTVRCDRSSTVASPSVTTPPEAAKLDRDDESDIHGGHDEEATTLYVWASDQARVAPDFLAVIDFDRRSPGYGNVLRTVPVPPPGNIGNEAHHCHTSVDQNILACGGLLSLLKSQNSMFFFDISNARYPKFLFSTRAANSSITDDFLPLPGGGFLVTNMGSATGGAGGRVVELDKHLRLVAEYPSTSPADGGFNPHGIDADFSRNMLVTSDFINPVTTLNVFTGDVQLRSSLRFWDLRDRRITRGPWTVSRRAPGGHAAREAPSPGRTERAPSRHRGVLHGADSRPRRPAAERSAPDARVSPVRGPDAAS